MRWKGNTVFVATSKGNADTVLPVRWLLASLPFWASVPHHCNRRLDFISKSHLNENSSCKGTVCVCVYTTLLRNLFILGTPTALYTYLNVLEHYTAVMGIYDMVPHCHSWWIHIWFLVSLELEWLHSFNTLLSAYCLPRITSAGENTKIKCQSSCHLKL